MSAEQSVNVGLSSATCGVLVFIAQIYPKDQVLGIAGKHLPWAYAGLARPSLCFPLSSSQITVFFF